MLSISHRWMPKATGLTHQSLPMGKVSSLTCKSRLIFRTRRSVSLRKSSSSLSLTKKDSKNNLRRKMRSLLATKRRSNLLKKIIPLVGILKKATQKISHLLKPNFGTRKLKSKNWDKKFLQCVYRKIMRSTSQKNKSRNTQIFTTKLVELKWSYKFSNLDKSILTSSRKNIELLRSKISS